MSTIDWAVLVATLGLLVGRGIWKGRGSHDVKGFLLADRNMPWYTVALSIMATQASAITFTSTPGQAYAAGLRFVQYYFGLPIAMVILCVTAVPLFHRLGVYTAYEFLEHRFDLKTRTLTSAIFMVQRGLGAGMTIYAPSLILSVMLGWDARITSAVIGGAIIIYTTTGGVKSVSWTHLQHLTIVMLGMIVAFVVAPSSWPRTGAWTSPFASSDALIVVANTETSLLISGTGGVVEPGDGILAIGSGGPFALAAARALIAHTDLGAREIATEALDIAAGICVYTNRKTTVEEL